MKIRSGGSCRPFMVGLLIVPVAFLRSQVSLLTDIFPDGVTPSLEGGNQALGDYSTTAPKPRSTLVHFDPYFMGGFRNQHMRFVSFVNFAASHNITQILLPSLRWGDTMNKPNSIHHELLFDVPYWNSRAGGMGLPLLVDYDPEILEGVVERTGSNGESSSAVAIACWNETSSLYSGLDEGFLRSPSTNLRKVNTWGMIGQGDTYSHCRRTLGDRVANDPKKIEEAARRDDNSTKMEHRYTHLVPHGGSMSSGRLWIDYGGLQGHRGKALETTMINGDVVQIHPEHVPVERAVYELLRPSRQIRTAATNAMNNALRNAATATEMGEGIRSPRVLALHPRVEPDMLTHRCGKYMDSNLTRVFERMETYPPFRGGNSSEYRFDLVFVAVSKEQIEGQTRGGSIGEILTQNREELHRASTHGLFGGAIGDGDGGRAIPIFQSGNDTAANVQFPRRRHPEADDAGVDGTSFDTPLSLRVQDLVGSIINFFTAVDADIFVGVRGSTYSTDAFSVRYYQRKEEGGRENYIIGPDGIQRLYGPAAPHTCK